MTNHTDDMPILDLDLSGTSRFEASRYLDTPEVISAYLSEAMKANDPAHLMRALAEVAKANGVNQLAEAAGVNRESLYKTLKGDGEKTRFDTIQKLLTALGVEMSVKPMQGKKLVFPPYAMRGARKATADFVKRKASGRAGKATDKPFVRLPAVASGRSRDADGKILKKPGKAVAKKPTAKKNEDTANA